MQSYRYVVLGVLFLWGLILPALASAETPPTALPPASAIPTPATTTRGPRLPVRTDLARLEPESGTYYGVHLDWSTTTAISYHEQSGLAPMVYVRSFRFPFEDGDLPALEDFISQVVAHNGIAMLNLEPFEGLSLITPDVADDLATRLVAYNVAGVPVFVRFAHEMNGSWYPWGQDPATYRETFRLLAETIHSRVPHAAMLWVPVYGSGYPFSGGQYEAEPGTPAFVELDTNNDGVLSMKDDMYAPYYPGDDAVDWVGMSLLHWGNQWPWGENEIPEAGKFVEQLRGTYNGLNGDEREVPDFYVTYAISHGKPLAIPETAALYNTERNAGASSLSIKQAWWQQAFDSQMLHDYPPLKMINWLEWRREESAAEGAEIDWSILQDDNPQVLQTFVADLPQDYLVFASNTPPITPTLEPALPPVPEHPPRSLQRLEPERKAYYGVNLDWGTDTPTAYYDRSGLYPMVYVRFFHFPFQQSDLTQLEEFIALVDRAGGMAMITLEPQEGLDMITTEVANDLASRLAVYNGMGVPVFVRFAHEMNGSWYAWSQDPASYREVFQLLAAAIHRTAPQTAMVWAPNYGAGYPFSGGQYEAEPGTSAFAELDTNNDGILSMKDDMYAPYYPGDDAVDWVGMSLYHWGNIWPWGENEIPEAGKFVEQLRGTYNGLNGDEREVPDFYVTYAISHGKPLVIPETAALYNTTVGGADRLLVKQMWWQQVFDGQTLSEYQSLKMINWFEWRKPETEIGGALIDWSITLDPHPVIQQHFLADLPREHLSFATPVEIQQTFLPLVMR